MLTEGCCADAREAAIAGLGLVQLAIASGLGIPFLG